MKKRSEFKKVITHLGYKTMDMNYSRGDYLMALNGIFTMSKSKHTLIDDDAKRIIAKLRKAYGKGHRG